MDTTSSSNLPIDTSDIVKFQELIHQRLGLKFNASRHDTLSKTLIKNAGSIGLNIDEYYLLLEKTSNDSDIWDELVKTLTVCETYFFRDLDQMDVLRRHILPQLIATHWIDRTLRIWSAGCSSGEEPYTLAILLRQLLPDIDQWKIYILGTDINKVALQNAARGHYHNWSFRDTDNTLLTSYFQKQDSGYNIIPQIKSMVHFTYLNIAEDNYPSKNNNTHEFDLILCRNVMIYLSETVIRNVVTRFYKGLKPGGWLVVAPSEASQEIYHQFHTLRFERAIVYQKIPAGNAPSYASDPFFTAENKNASRRTPTLSLSDQSEKNKDHLIKRPSVSKMISPSIAVTDTQKPDKTSINIAPKMDLTESILEKATRLAQQHNYQEAKLCFLSYIKNNPADLAVKIKLAFLEANSGELDNALAIASTVIKQNPLTEDAYYISALVHQEKGEFEQGISQFKKVLYLNPDHILAHYHLHTLYGKTGYNIQSWRHHEQAISLAKKCNPDEVLPGSDSLSVNDFLDMVKE